MVIYATRSLKVRDLYTSGCTGSNCKRRYFNWNHIILDSRVYFNTTFTKRNSLRVKIFTSSAFKRVSVTKIATKGTIFGVQLWKPSVIQKY